jgi:hypothetical protein
MNATRFSSDTWKKAITRNIKKINIAKTNPVPFAPALLNVEKTHKANTTPTAKTISCTKLTENPIRENATPEKNPFLICCGNITFIIFVVGIKILQ